jgi:hypothetical protein
MFREDEIFLPTFAFRVIPLTRLVFTTSRICKVFFNLAFAVSLHPRIVSQIAVRPQVREDVKDQLPPLVLSYS